MKKIVLLALVLAVVAIAGVEGYSHGVCGKFTPDRMLTHVLRHCAKPADDLRAPVTPKCCDPLSKISDACFVAIFNSDTWKNGIRHHGIAATIPKRCHLLHHS